MGDIARAHAAEEVGKKIDQLFKKELKSADVVISVLGGVVSVDHFELEKVKIVVIDYDNAEESGDPNDAVSLYGY